MTNFTAFDVLAYAVDAFQNGGTGVTQRRGGKVPWWAQREYLERLLEEERRLERERTRLKSRELSRAEEAVVEAEALLETFKVPAAPKRVRQPKPAPAAVEPEPLSQRLMGPFQHLLRRPAARPSTDFTSAEINDIIDAIEALENHERELEHA